MTFRAPKGTDDVLPPASRTWRRVLRAWDDWAERFGYELVLNPIFEATEVFARGVGEATEIVQKQMYTFRDKGGRWLTLRPEGTASVVRAYLQTGATGALKVSYSGPMFRYEQPQAGRRRQFYQVGVEYVGAAAAAADAEVIEVGYRFLADLGMPTLEVQVNSIGDPVCRPAYLELLRNYLEQRRDRLCEDSLRRLESNPLRVLDCKVCAPRLEEAPSPVDHLCEECAQHYAEVLERLEALAVPYREAPRLVRGLDYYTRTAFEYVAPSLEAAQNAVGGGGRYDGLAEVLGGPPVPGVGLAMGIDRIMLALGEVAEPPALDLYVVVAAAELQPAAAGLVSELRRAGLRVDTDPEGRSVRAQFRAADRRGAAGVAVVGEEWQDGKVTVRDLESGAQEIIAVEEVAAWARS